MNNSDSVLRHSRSGLALLGCALVSGAATLPAQAVLCDPVRSAETGPPAAVVVVDGAEAGFTARVERVLLQLGYEEDVASAIAPMISEEDLRTLAEHPEMLRVGGDVDDDDLRTVYFVVGILLIVLLLLAIV